MKKNLYKSWLRAAPARLLYTGLFALFFSGLFSKGAQGAQAPGETPVHWTISPPNQPIRAGETFKVKIGASIDADWHLYSVTQPQGGPNPTRFSVVNNDLFELAGPIQQSPPQVEFDPNFGINTEFFSAGAEFHAPLLAASILKPGNYEARIQVIYQVCNDRVCLPPKKEILATQITIVAGEARKVDSKPAASPQSSPGVGGPPPLGTLGAATAAPPSPERPRSTVVPSTTTQPLSTQPIGTAAEFEGARLRGFLPFLWLAMTMGALSLATPCVFPMIPITVSYFTKSAESQHTSGIKQALVYSLGIVFTFTGLGLGLAALLGATGINQFAANPWVNLLITAIFIGFALNLFGLYQIGVPSSVLTRLSNFSKGGMYLQTLLMGLTFTLTSFTCTVPFVGTVLVATSRGDWLWPALGMLGFSTVFAAPFFVLALIPRFLTSLPRSGGWLNSVKVTMGFLEVAAAMKFISNVDLVWNWHIFSRPVVLAVWLAVAVLATIYLLGKFQLPHDSPLESLGVFRLMSAMTFLAIAFYLFTGLLGGSLGELDAFLPPLTSSGILLPALGARGAELTWHNKRTAALEQSQRENKAIFIDFTGYTCTNCRWMEANIFPLPAVRAELDKFVRLQLYTDGVGKEFEENQKYQKEQFGTVALPLYVILDSQGNPLKTFPGMTRKPEEFLHFLRSGVQRVNSFDTRPAN